MSENKIFIECDCGTHLLQISKDEELNLFYLAMFKYGKEKRGLFERLKIAYRMIFKDEVYSDQLVINVDETKKMIDFINSNFSS